MYNQPTAAQMEPLYKMDPAIMESMHKVKDQIHGTCSKYMNHPVQVQTVHGHVYEGYIVHIDATHLYLKPMPGHVRGFLNPLYNAYTYNNVILPLVLYELLVITLLST
ncbi:MAG: hypothetical protein K0S39_4897 [Paenibacillus sp.]|jgi:hypothetical protein|nr:hypothetical protein [Paenibacillus sp.]